MSERRAVLLPYSSLEDLKEAGALLSASKMFGSINPAQGFVIACTCLQTGQAYNEYEETYHFLGDRKTMRADAMVANLLDLGGEFKILSRTPDKAEVWVKYRSAEGTFSLTKEEVFEEPFAYRGKPSDQMAQLKKPLEQRDFKDKYATPRSRCQMLWARVVSDAVRAVCPQANRGVYTPEEVEDFPESAASTAGKSRAVVPVSAPVELPPELCPVEGKLFGTRWDSMDKPTLEYALANLALPETCKAVIETLLKK